MSEACSSISETFTSLSGTCSSISGTFATTLKKNHFDSENGPFHHERTSIRSDNGVMIEARVLSLELIFFNVVANVPDIETPRRHSRGDARRE
jgi:hypothetical protein